MNNLQNASLVLNTSQGTDTSVGTIKTSHTWFNINLRTLLGDMYEKYDIFNLCLNTVATTSSTANFNLATKDLQVIVRVSGLPFINSTYNITSSNNYNSNYCSISTFTFVQGNYTSQNYNSSNIATFGKSQELCNITIDYIRVGDLLQPSVSATNKFPDCVFIFEIFGIDKDKENKNATRLYFNN